MKIENVEDLKTAIQGIIVKDYGDFKRKTVLYLNRYEETLPSITPETQKKMAKMKWHIQYHPSGDIEPTRQWCLNQLDSFSN